MAMNLGDLATFICKKVRHTDALSLAACKEFINRRYQMIYDAENWRESLFLTTPTIDPTLETSDPLDRAGRYTLPALIDKVVAVRTDQQQLRVAQQEEYFRIDLNAFEQTGTPAQFSILPPMAWDFGLISSDWYDLDEDFTLSGNSDSGAKVRAVYQNAADADKSMTLRYQNQDGTLSDKVFPANVSQYTSITSWTAYVSKIVSVTKPVTTGSLALIYKLNGGSTLGFITMSSSDTVAPTYRRLQLTYIPTVATQLRILFKMAWTELDSDDKSPILGGIDNVIIPFVQADMLQRERQYAKAQVCVQEGQALLEQYKKSEVYQQAYETRIVPDAEPNTGNGFYDGSTRWLRG
jgi:hypothetical protein